MVKAVRAWPKPWGVAKAVGELAKAFGPWRHRQGSGGGVKAVGPVSKPWGRDQSLGGVAKAMGE